MRRVPWAPLALVAALLVPAAGSRFYTFVANDVVIWALFATSLNLLVGYSGLVSFGHAAYFGIGAYTTGLLMKKAALPFLLAFPAAGVLAGAFALLFGVFCVRLTRIYFAMLTLAFAQFLYTVAYKWRDLTGGSDGIACVPKTALFWGGPSLATPRAFYFVVAVSLIGVNVRRYELAAFVLAGAFAGLAGGLFGIFNRGVFPDFAYWTKSSEVLIMTLLGGMGTFYGPTVGALALILLNQQITSYTEYWPFVLGSILVALLFGFPGGLAGAAIVLWARARGRLRSA
ncbi:MAG: branched-chain amino acid ABC transporter permease [Candidatus Rokuibacteriota bacterium]|nr:MAG: branched-chain amino acid ABC transporter permease [Candidatus Rokubacteria bacterium]